MARPKKEKTKSVRFEMRMTPEQLNVLDSCSASLEKTKAETVITALELLEKKLKAKKK